MPDTLSQTQRSYNMSHIRGKNTKPEILVRKGLHARGFRFRIHNKSLPGSPDIVLPKYGVVIMVNGCFWHGHKGCRYATRPKSNVEFWDGVTYVYILKEGIAREREIQILWEQNGYFIISESFEGLSSRGNLALNDLVILDEKNLYDGKFIH